MEEFWNAQWRKKPYTISYENDKLSVVVCKENVQLCGNHDIWVLDFLYRSLRKQLYGCIINLEDMNAPLQLSIFLKALKQAQDLKPILILSPDDDVVKWHYFLSKCTGFRIKTIFRECSNLDDDNVLIVGHSDLKLCEELQEIDFFSVIIDKFDEVATKMVLRKLRGEFNVGVTYRNFYTNPDQKLQWTMLNWANPGSVGKLNKFYEIDNDNFANSRDNYKEWWFRITWSLCDSFTKPTIEEKGRLLKTLKTWAGDNDLMKFSFSPIKKRKRKENGETTTKKKQTERKNVKEVKELEIDKKNDSSSDTVIINDFNASPPNIIEETEKVSLPPDLSQSSDNYLMSQLFEPPKDESDLPENSLSSLDGDLMDQLFGSQKNEISDLPQHSKSNSGNELIEQLFVSQKTLKKTVSDVDELVAEVMDFVGQE